MSEKTIKDIAKEAGTSVRQIGIAFGIPRRTIGDWSAGVSVPPDYILNLIAYAIEKGYLQEHPPIDRRKNKK